MSETLHWHKSSYSNASGGDCIEVAFAWRKSSYSDDSGGNCIEVATCPDAVHVRDSKNPEGPTFTVAPDAWSQFVRWTE